MYTVFCHLYFVLLVTFIEGGGYAIVGVCLSVCLFFSLSVNKIMRKVLSPL